MSVVWFDITFATPPRFYSKRGRTPFAERSLLSFSGAGKQVPESSGLRSGYWNQIERDSCLFFDIRRGGGARAFATSRQDSGLSHFKDVRLVGKTGLSHLVRFRDFLGWLRKCNGHFKQTVVS